jgi:hypothetical protein
VKGRTTNDATHSARRTLDVSDKNVLSVSAAAKAALVVEQQPALVCSSVGVVLNVGRGSLDLNVAGRLADGSRAGLLMRCESRRCGGDRDGGSTRRQQWCDVFQFHSHDGTP